MSSIEIGDHAPDFSLPSQSGEQIRLADFRGNTVVLFFYPKNETAICTREACRFRDDYQDFQDAGAVVLGVSSDSVESHQSFADNHRLPFILLSDSNGVLRRAYGVPSTMGILPGRVTFVIDPQGIVQMRFSNRFAADQHAAEALVAVRKIAQAAEGGGAVSDPES